MFIILTIFIFCQITYVTVFGKILNIQKLEVYLQLDLSWKECSLISISKLILSILATEDHYQLKDVI